MSTPTANGWFEAAGNHPMNRPSADLTPAAEPNDLEPTVQFHEWLKAHGLKTVPIDSPEPNAGQGPLNLGGDTPMIEAMQGRPRSELTGPANSTTDAAGPQVAEADRILEHNILVKIQRFLKTADLRHIPDFKADLAAHRHASEQAAVAAKFDALRKLLKERSRGEVDTWGFVAAFLGMIDEVEGRK